MLTIKCVRCKEKILKYKNKLVWYIVRRFNYEKI